MDIPIAFGGNSDHDINADPSCSRITDPDMTLCGSSGLDISMTSLCGSTGCSDQYDPWGQHGLWTSAWLQVEAQTPPTHFRIGPGGSLDHGSQHRLQLWQGIGPRCGLQWQQGPGPHCDLRWQFSSYQHGPQWQPGQGPQNSPRLQPRPLSSAWPSLETCATERRLYPWP